MDIATNAKETSGNLGLIALFAGVIAIGMAPILVRFGDADPSAIAFWRIALTLPIFYWLAFKKKSQVTSKPTRRDYGWLALTGIAFAANLSCWHFSITLTNIANATLFDNSAPIFVCLITWLIFKQPLNKVTWLGLSLTVIGGILLTLPHLSFKTTHLRGDMIGILAGFFYALYIIAVQKARRAFSVMVLMAHSGLISCLTLLVCLPFTGESLVIHSVSGGMAIFALAFLVHFSGQGLITYALRFVPATLSSITLLGQAIIATIAAWFIFQEHLIAIQLVGTATILVGIGTAQYAHRRKTRTTV